MTSVEQSVPPRRRHHARLLVAPFCDVFVAPHFDGPQTRPVRELAQDVSAEGVSFFSSRPWLVDKADSIRAVTLECPDGLAATLGVRAAHVRRLREDAPARVALQFAYPRPRVRLPTRLRRLADGFYAPAQRANATRLVRAILGIDPTASDRRAVDRIRVPLEANILVELLCDGAVVGTATLADVSPHGFACYADAPVARSFDAVRLLWEGRELIARAVEACFAEEAVVRGSDKTRLRLIVGGNARAPAWHLPLWAALNEFGSLRLRDARSRASLIQSALLAREEVHVAEALESAERAAALDICYDAFVDEGYIDAESTPRHAWSDPFDPQATVYVAKAGDVVIGTVRFVGESALGLPLQTFCPRELWPASSARRAEFGHLAVARAYRGDVNRRIGVAMALILAIVERCIDDGFEEMVIGAKTDHERFYRAIGWKPTTPVFSHVDYGVDARLFRFDLDAYARFRRVVGFLRR